jgi:hypothetical protein
MVANELTAADVALLAYTRQAHLGGIDMSCAQGFASTPSH